jgi:Co/Zn/Cd efflux system component
MWLLSRHREGGAHMKASWIFTTNDVIANIGVIVAASLVRFTGSNVPDLVVATGIALIVLNGAVRILRLEG